MTTEPRPRARLIANYLPQFHPIPENDAWWGQGFTEWRNVAAARPLFPGHDQPRQPGELGFYDLRVPEVRRAQASLAASHGIEAFCYWHYWFGGKLLLERPLEEVLATAEPDFPICVGWANQSWSGIWHGAPERVLIEQTYPGREDDEAHFEYLLPAFRDPRYLHVRGSPLFLVFQPQLLPDALSFTRLWRDLANKAGLPGLHLVAHARDDWPFLEFGFDASTFAYHAILVKLDRRRRLRQALGRLSGWPESVYRFPDAVPHMHGPRHPYPLTDGRYPTILTGWDNSPRSGSRSLILRGYEPEAFRVHVRNVLSRVAHKDPEDRIVFVKSWNEWAEGNYLEPDLRYGRAFLEVLRDEVGA